MPPAILSKYLHLPRYARWSILAGLVFVLYVIVAGALLPFVAKRALEAELPEALKRHVEVDGLGYNPFTNVLTVSGLRVLAPETNETVAGVGRVVVDLSAASIFKLAGEVSELRIEHPVLRIVRRADGTLNISDLLESSGKAESKDSEKKKGDAGFFPFILHNFVLADGEVVFADESTGRRFNVENVDLNVPFASSLSDYAETSVKPRFSAVVNGDPVRFDGDALPFANTLATRFDVRLWGVNLDQYWAYVPLPGRGLSLKDGLFSMNCTLDFERSESILPKVSLSGTVEVDNLQLAGPDGRDRFGFVSLVARLASVELLERRIHVASVDVETPYLAIKREADGNLELLKLALGPDGLKSATNGAQQKQAPASEAAALPDVRVDRFDIHGGVVYLEDAAVRPEFHERIAPLDLSVRNVTLGSEAPCSYSLWLRTDKGLALSAGGLAGLQPVSIDGDLTLSGLRLPALAPYYQPAAPCRLDSGTLDLRLGYRVDTANGTDVSASNLGVSLRDLALSLPGASRPFLEMAGLDVSGGELDLAGRRARVADILLDRPVVRVLRGSDGALDVAALAKSSASGEGKAAKTEGLKPKPVAAGPKASAAAGSKSWDALVGAFRLKDGRVELRDEAVSPAADLALSMMQLSVFNASADPGKELRANLQFALDQQSKVELAAQATPNPLAAAGRIRISMLPLEKANPYLAQVAPVHLKSGRFYLAGRYAIKQGKDLSVAFDGGLGLNKLRATDRSRRPLFGLEKLRVSDVSVRGLPVRGKVGGLSLQGVSLMDPAKGAQAFGLGELAMSSLQFEQAPLSAVVDGVHLQGLDVRAERDKDGLMNFSRIAASLAPAKGKSGTAPAANAAGPGAKEEAGAPLDQILLLRRITLSDGKAAFKDESLKPPYEVSVDKMSGEVVNERKNNATVTDLELNATIDGQGKMFVTAGGDALLASGDTYLDVRLDNVGLTGLSPYTIKSLAHPISKGKLRGNTRISLRGKELDGDNRLLIENFDFGDEVDSPDAMNLPLGLALALLRDTNGNIQVDLPMSGSLDDPNFSVAGMVLSAIANLIVKAATSPFAALGSLFGGEQNSRVIFASGSAALSADAADGLDQVVDGLKQRPALKVEVLGFVDPEADADALSETAFHALVARPLTEKMEEDGEPVPPEGVSIPPDDYDDYLEDAYAEADVPKETNFLGLVKYPEPAVMEARLRNATKAGPVDLESLARRRAEAVRDYFVNHGGIDASRVFLQRPDASAPTDAEDVARSRVELELE
ncbi:MAG: hypothetical protein PWQ57_3114 [Desulfovibrionales bacterium]|nr:hypothetical protein [Desulfovibrionales bacterium]